MSESALDRERKAHQNTKDAAQRDRLEFQQTLDLESQFRTSAWNELLKAFDDPDDREDNGLKELVRVLTWGKRSAHPLRGLPRSDTMRTGHPDLTSTEAAGLAGGKRAMLRRWNGRLLNLANDFDRELSGSDEPKDKMPPKPRCRRRECAAMDKRLPYGSTKCPVCWQPLTSEERVSA